MTYLLSLHVVWGNKIYKKRYDAENWQVLHQEGAYQESCQDPACEKFFWSATAAASPAMLVAMVLPTWQHSNVWMINYHFSRCFYASLCKFLQMVPLHLMGKSFTHEDSPFEPKQGKLDHQSSRPSQTQLSWRFCSVKNFCTFQLSAQKMKTTQFWFLTPHYALCLGPTLACRCIWWFGSGREG